MLAGVRYLVRLPLDNVEVVAPSPQPVTAPQSSHQAALLENVLECEVWVLS